MHWRKCLASGWLCIAAGCNAGAADSQANPFVSCRLSLTTDSKRNGRLYRGLLFLVLHLIVLIHYITCLMPILPPLGFYFCSFSKAAKSCGFPLLSLSPPYYLNWSLLKLDEQIKWAEFGWRFEFPRRSPIKLLKDQQLPSRWLTDSTPVIPIPWCFCNANYSTLNTIKVFYCFTPWFPPSWLLYQDSYPTVSCLFILNIAADRSSEKFSIPSLPTVRSTHET